MVLKRLISIVVFFFCGAACAQTFGPVSTQQFNYVYLVAGPTPTNLLTVGGTNSASALFTACAANSGNGMVVIQQGANPSDAPTIGGVATYTITGGCAGVTILDERGTVGATCYAYSNSTTYLQSSCSTSGSSGFNLPAALAASPYCVTTANAGQALTPDGTISGKIDCVKTAVNVMNYGCVGDGTHDDTGCFTAALAAGCATGRSLGSGGGNVTEVDVPPAATNYLITSALSPCSYTHLRGLGGQPIIIYTGTGALFSFTAGTVFVEIDHLYMQGSYTANTWAIQHGSGAGSVYHNSYHDNQIVNFGNGTNGGGIDIEADSNTLTIERNIFGNRTVNILFNAATDGLSVTKNVFGNANAYPSEADRCIDVTSGSAGSATAVVGPNNLFNCVGLGAMRINASSQWIVYGNEEQSAGTITDANNAVWDFVTAGQVIFTGNSTDATGGASYDVYLSSGITNSIFDKNTSQGNSNTVAAFGCATSTCSSNVFPLNYSGGPTPLYAGTYSVLCQSTGTGCPSGYGTITASPQYELPFYSASGTAQTITGDPNFKDTAGVVSIINTAASATVTINKTSTSAFDAFGLNLTSIGAVQLENPSGHFITLQSATGTYSPETVTVPNNGLTTDTVCTQSVPCPGFANPMTTLGDMIYGGASGVPTRLAGVAPLTSTPYILNATGTGSAAGTPSWGTFQTLLNGATLATGTQPVSGTTQYLFYNNGGVLGLTQALPNGTTATTQAANDNTTKVATTAYADRAGSAAISGLTSGYIPLAGSATTITGNSHLDDGVTKASTITSTEPIVAPSLTGTDGSGDGLVMQACTSGGGSGCIYTVGVTPGAGNFAFASGAPGTDVNAPIGTNIAFTVGFSQKGSVDTVGFEGAIGAGAPAAGTFTGVIAGDLTDTSIPSAPCVSTDSSGDLTSGCPTLLYTAQFYWNIQSALFATATLLGPVWFSPATTTHTSFNFSARSTGTISCATLPTLNVMDLGTSPTTNYAGATSITSQAVSGTSGGVSNVTGGSVNLAAGHYYGIAYSAGTCVTAPTVDATLITN